MPRRRRQDDIACCLSRLIHTFDVFTPIKPPRPPLTRKRTDLTTTAPTPTDTTSLAGLSHTWTLSTPYYTTTLPIWIDEIAHAPSWIAEFLKPEAAEVVRAVGAWVYVFAKHEGKKEEVLETMKGIQDVVEKGAGLAWDGVCLAVGVRNKGLVGTSERVVEEGAGEGGWGGFEEWEDAARERGFEYVDAEMKGRNEFGEQTGMVRVKEALEANEWEGGDDGGDLDGFGEGESDDEDWSKTFAAEEAEMGMEIMGLKTELNGGEGADDEDQAAQVEELERMMSKLSGIRGMCFPHSWKDSTMANCLRYRSCCWYARRAEEEVRCKSRERLNKIALMGPLYS